MHAKARRWDGLMQSVVFTSTYASTYLVCGHTNSVKALNVLFSHLDQIGACYR